MAARLRVCRKRSTSSCISCRNCRRTAWAWSGNHSSSRNAGGRRATAGHCPPGGGGGEGQGCVVQHPRPPPTTHLQTEGLPTRRGTFRGSQTPQEKITLLKMGKPLDHYPTHKRFADSPHISFLGFLASSVLALQNTKSPSACHSWEAGGVECNATWALEKRGSKKPDRKKEESVFQNKYAKIEKHKENTKNLLEPPPCTP